MQTDQGEPIKLSEAKMRLLLTIHERKAVTPTYLRWKFECSATNISLHLAQFLTDDLVKCENVGKRKFYSISKKGEQMIDRVKQAVELLAAHQMETKIENERKGKYDEILKKEIKEMSMARSSDYGYPVIPDSIEIEEEDDPRIKEMDNETLDILASWLGGKPEYYNKDDEHFINELAYKICNRLPKLSKVSNELLIQAVSITRPQNKEMFDNDKLSRLNDDDLLDDAIGFSYTLQLVERMLHDNYYVHVRPDPEFRANKNKESVKQDEKKDHE